MNDERKFVIHKRVSFTLLILIIYMLGCSVPVPFTHISSNLKELINNPAFGTVSMISGANLQRISLFSIGLNPLMIAMLLMQLLVLFRFFHFDTLSKGQRLAFQQILILIFTIMQAAAVAVGLQITNTSYQTIAAIIILSAGSLFVVWLGIQNMKYGIGGTIVIILFNIVSFSLPTLANAIKSLMQLENPILWLLLLCSLSLLICVFWIAFNHAYYPISLINTSLPSRTRKLVLPIGLNMGAGMTYMVGMALLLLPMIIRQRFPRTIFANLKFDVTLSGLITFLLFYFFSYAMFNPYDQAKSLRNNNNYILNVRPGRPTQRYLTKCIFWCCLPGAVINTAQLVGSMTALMMSGKFAGLALIPVNIVMVVMLINSISDQLLILFFPSKYNQLIKKEYGK